MAGSEFYTVDGIEQHVLKLGSGSPTVVFESGSNYGTGGWGTIVDEISKQTSVVCTDRPGLGLSRMSKTKRTLDDAADRLHSLLAAAGVLTREELVFVGWSNGCMYLRRMLERHPEVKPAVKGIVFIDSYHECSAKWFEEAGLGSISEMIGAKHKPLESMRRLMNFASGSGLASLFISAEKAKTSFITALFYEVLVRSKTGWDGFLDELHFSVEMLYDGNKPKSLDDTPLTVISATCADKSLATFEEMLAKDPAATNEGIPVAAFLATVKRWQKDLVGLSSRAKEIRAAVTTAHAVHFNEPRLVIDAIREYACPAAGVAPAQSADYSTLL